MKGAFFLYPPLQPDLTILQRAKVYKYLLFVRINQFFVISVFELSWCFCSGQGGMEDEQLPRTVCCLKEKKKNYRKCPGWESSTLRESEINENMGTFYEPSTICHLILSRPFVFLGKYYSLHFID